VRFLIKGLYLPHYYQNGSLLAVLPSVLFHLFFLATPWRVHLSGGSAFIHISSNSISNVAPFTYNLCEKRLRREIYRLLFLSHPLDFYFLDVFLFSQIKTFCIFRFLCVGVCTGKGTLFEDLSGEIKFIFSLHFVSSLSRNFFADDILQFPPPLT
jgi:hypothetical protein